MAAKRLRDAAATRSACPPVRDVVPAGDLDAAYRIQALNTEERLRVGQRVVGRKIGLTSRAVQRQFGVSQPDFGVLFADMAFADGQQIGLERFIQPRVEAEVAFVLGADIDTQAPTVADVVLATDHLLPAIEVIDSRIADWDIGIVDTVADNGSSGAFVLGTTPRRIADLDLAEVGMVLERGGRPVSTGAGAACLGSPVVAVSWLAGEVARRGHPLRAGEIVLSGALGPTVTVPAAGSYRARIDGFGEVRAVFVDSGSTGRQQ